MQNIFGEKIIDQIAFINTPVMICEFLESVVGIEASHLYQSVSNSMEEEFQSKYHRNMSSYSGVKGMLRKAQDYREIDYTGAYNMINEYKKGNKSYQNKFK